ncbi:hypothetical protein DFH28DRAFT_897257 [Melampsora americana]|nr:hypothetical protein DFH28DRAFT_897257 [Melampsora americana]
MSISNIESTAARLNALNDPTGNGQQSSEINTNNANNNNISSRTNLRIEARPTGPTYNKQALISSYLGRGKDAIGPRQPGPLEGPNKRNDNSKQVFTNLPKIYQSIHF